MRIEIRNDSVEIDGYVNAVARDSRPLRDRKTGEPFLEQIVPGAFSRALARREVQLMLDHERAIGSTRENLTLHEDSIGLRAHAVITDAETVQKARERKLRGWSFGFYELAASEEEARAGMKRRFIEDLDLREVSIIDDRKLPCYEGTLIETRSEGTDGSEDYLRSDVLEVRAEYIEAEEPPRAENESTNYDSFKERIRALEGK